jgi:hypothetical protein
LNASENGWLNNIMIGEKEMDKIIAWFLEIGRLLFHFTKTTAGKIITEYEDDVLKIVINAAKQPGSGQEKMSWAIVQLTALIPEIAVYTARAVLEVVYATWKEEQEKIDTDGDGVPDYRDLCKDIGDQGCGVDKDGCPIPCPPVPI